jgi:hypothetical protein
MILRLQPLLSFVDPGKSDGNLGILGSGIMTRLAGVSRSRNVHGLILGYIEYYTKLYKKVEIS